MKRNAKMFGEGSKEYHGMLYGVMEGNEESLESMSLSDVMQDIQNFLDACYVLGMNPLSLIRKILPQYVWEYHRVKDQRSIKRTVVDADFIWRLDWHENCSDRYHLITATKPGLQHRSNCFWVGIMRHSGVSATEQMAQIDFIRKVNGNPVE